MPVFNLQSGTAQYALKTTSSVKLEALAKTVAPTTAAGRTEPAGSFSIGGNKAAGFWTPGHTALVVVGAGAAAGLGVGIYEATSGGAAVSPSQ